MPNSTEIKRLTIVLAIALTGVLLSFLFLRPEALDEKKVRVNSLAYVLELNNDVQKKTSDDLIWHIALPGDELYVGDLIRTSKDSTALLEFQKSGSKIHLSEDSTIVIDKEQPEKVSLTMVRGDIFVQALSNAQKIRLQTAEGSVELGEGQVNLSFDNENRLSLNVYEGQAELERAGKKTSVRNFESASTSQTGINVSKQLFQFTSPALREKVFVKASSPFMKVAWSAH